MAQLNVHLSDDVFFKFRELKTILKCRTNEDTIEKIIIQQHKSNSIKPTRDVQQHKSNNTAQQHKTHQQKA